MELHVGNYQVGRYFRRVQLGQRFLTHGARPQTICDRTTSTWDQLATLRRRWGFEVDESLRGPSPSSYEDFFSSVRRRRQAALFLSICEMVGAVPPRRGKAAAEGLPSVDIGERLCKAVEIFREWEPDAAKIRNLAQIQIIISSSTRAIPLRIGVRPRIHADLLAHRVP